MELEFEKPQVPNFIRVKNGIEIVPIGELTKEELEQFIVTWAHAAREQHRKRKKN